MTFSIEHQHDDGFETVVLRDGEGREVRIAPSAGFNAYAFRVPYHGATLPIFVEPETTDALRGGGFGFGCPILFPFQNRVRDGRFTFEGREYSLDINSMDGNAIHGFACHHAWSVLESGADETRGAFVTAAFDTRDDAEVQRQFPFSAHLTLTYALREGALHLDAVAENRGDTNLPMGFSIHPWFHAPLSKGGSRAHCTLRLPARGYWELESEEQLLPTGRVLALDEQRDFSRGANLKSVSLDDVFTELVYEKDEHVCTFEDPAAALRLEMRSSREFREFVVFAPLDHDVICLEPYTSTSDFANLAARGIESGLITLSPGAQWRGHIALRVDPV
jgi:aldose 1-epimerase